MSAVREAIKWCLCLCPLSLLHSLSLYFEQPNVLFLFSKMTWWRAHLYFHNLLHLIMGKKQGAGQGFTGAIKNIYFIHLYTKDNVKIMKWFMLTCQLTCHVTRTRKRLSILMFVSFPFSISVSASVTHSWTHRIQILLAPYSALLWDQMGEVCQIACIIESQIQEASMGSWLSGWYSGQNTPFHNVTHVLQQSFWRNVFKANFSTSPMWRPAR